MSLASKLLSASGGVDKLYSDDVFSAYTRTGTGADAVITTGIDMTKGYMLWSKGRSGATDHAIYDSSRGVTFDLASNTTAAQTTQTTGLKAVSTTGHTVGSLAKMNTSSATYVDWVMRRAPKFFDVVTYTGNGVAGRQIPHALGVAPGMMIVKCTSNATTWAVYHRANTANPETDYLQLNTTDATLDFDGVWNDTAPTASVFTLGSNSLVNGNGFTYVAYLFAHDPSADGIVQCGSFTTDGSGSATVNLGWEPQYVLLKKTSAAGDWFICDAARGFDVSGGSKYLSANASAAEAGLGSIQPFATGFKSVGALNPTTDFVYLAIRRPNKPPSLGTQVYSAIARTGNSATTAVTGIGFAPDLVIDAGRSGGYWHSWWDRLRGANKGLDSSSTAAETALTVSLNSFDQNGITVGTDANQWINYTGVPYINHFFKRAPGVFDVVCYTGTGVAENHSLGVTPEMVVYKARGTTSNWGVDFANHTGYLNQTAALTATPVLSDPTRASATIFRPWSAYGTTTVAYLFATKAGISKVGSYTGNGSSLTIDCGFTTGARFVMIKRTDSTGDWYVWDSTRGIIAGNDPHLSLNTYAAEVTTDDSVDPVTSGIIVNQVAATNVNVNAASYIYLAFA